MSDTKLRPEDLTAEERAIVLPCALNYWNNEHPADESWRLALVQMEPFLLARRALFAPEPEKVAKVECPNCGEMTERSHSRYEGPGPDKWACQPAPPEPAAREMPEAVRDAVDTLRSGVPSYPTWRRYADALESWWRNLAQPVASSDAVAELVNVTERTINKLDRTWDQFFAPVRGAITTVRQQAAQPVAVGMTEELRMILDVAESRAEDQRHDGLLECSRNLERAIAAVRQQAAQGRKVELGKVRELVNDLKRALSEAAPSEMTMLDPHEWRSDLDAVFAELDAAEGKRRE